MDTDSDETAERRRRANIINTAVDYRDKLAKQEAAEDVADATLLICGCILALVDEIRTGVPVFD